MTLGGASVGDHDLVHDVLTGEGMTLDFWKIAMRPGKPLMFGRMGEIRCIGLPGNPVASLVCSQLFLKPLLARLGGRSFRQDFRQAKLAAPMPANDRRQDYVRAAVSEEDGMPVAKPFGIQDSSMLGSGRCQRAHRARAFRTRSRGGRSLPRADAALICAVLPRKALRTVGRCCTAMAAR